jgi:hypothetical protein
MGFTPRHSKEEKCPPPPPVLEVVVILEALKKQFSGRYNRLDTL